MGLFLYPHNQETYEKVLAVFKENNRTCIVKPTGTGKSFVFLKWIEDNPSDRFIYISPSTEIFNQLEEYVVELNQEKLLNNVETISYQKLIRMSQEELKSMHADKIIVDEFHRAGAEQWGKALQIMLDSNPEAKVLGGTATPVRYLDEGKNMAEMLFNGNIASYMTLGEAVALNILPTFTYIPVWYDYDEKLERYQKLIAKTPKDKQPEMEKKLNLIKRSLQNSYGAEDIFKKYMPTDHGKYIVFCRNYEHLQEIKPIVSNWLRPVNTNVRHYVSVVRNTDKDEQLIAFKNDKNEDAIRLLFVIDRLNEGIHVKDVDGIIMLRPTGSPIIYLQQLGRALASGVKTPIVFDMVNNFQNLLVDEDVHSNIFEIEFRETRNRKEYEFSKNVFDEEFLVFEQMYSFSTLLKDLSDSLDIPFEKKWEKTYQLCKEYVTEKGCLPPQKKKYKGVALGTWISAQKVKYKNGMLPKNKEVKLRSLGVDFDVSREDVFNMRWESRYNLLKMYMEENGCEPKADVIYKDFALGAWIKEQKSIYNQGKMPSERAEKLRFLGIRLGVSREARLQEKWETEYKVFEEYIAKNGCFPSCDTVYKDFNLGKWFFTQKKAYKEGKMSLYRESQLRILGLDFDISHNDKQWEETFTLFKEYKETFGRMPSKGESYKGVNIEWWLGTQKKDYKDGKMSPEREAKLRSIGIMLGVPLLEKQWEDNYILLKECLETKGNLSEYKGVNLRRWLADQKTLYRKGKMLPEREKKLCLLGINLDKKIEAKAWDESFQAAKKYTEIYGCPPKGNDICENINVGSWVYEQKRVYRKGKLSKAHEKQLRSLGILLEETKQDIVDGIWEKNFCLLSEYMQKEKHLPAMSVRYKGVQIRIWFNTQKTIYKKGNLSSKQEEKLRSLGIDLDVDMKNEQWEQMFAACKEYMQIKGTAPIYNTTFKDLKIGNWLIRQKSAYRQNGLPSERAEKLLSLGIQM